MDKQIWVTFLTASALFCLILAIADTLRRLNATITRTRTNAEFLDSAASRTNDILESTSLGNAIEERFAGIGQSAVGRPLLRLSERLGDFGLLTGPARLSLLLITFALFGGILGELFASAFVPGVLITIGVEVLGAGLLLRQSDAANPRRISQQLPRALELMSNSLAGGQSLADACARVAQDMSEPIRSLFRRVVTAVNSGQAPDEALQQMAQRYNVPELTLVVVTIQMITQTSGNLLPGALADLAAISRQRQTLSQKIAGMTVQSRVSATVMTLIGPVFILVTYLMSPEYMGSLFVTTAGRWIFSLSFLWLVCGWVAIRFVSRVRV